MKHELNNSNGSLPLILVNINNSTLNYKFILIKRLRTNNNIPN